MEDRDLTSLSDAEQHMVTQLYSGDVADLSGLTVRAAVVRAFLAGPQGAVPDAVSSDVRIHGATIDGVLDFEGCILERSLTLTSVRIVGAQPDGALILRDARLNRMSLQNCTLVGALSADRSDIRNGLFIGGGAIEGPLQIRGARLGGAFAVEAARIGDGQAAIVGHGVDVLGPMILRHTECLGAVSLAHARLRAGVHAQSIICVPQDADEDTDTAPAALDFEGAAIEGDVLLNEGRLGGALKVRQASITGKLDCPQLQVAARGIDAEGIRVGQSLLLDGAVIGGAVVLDGAEVAKRFSGADLAIEGGETALSAHVTTFGGDVTLSRMRAIGEVRMTGAQIRGRLNLDDARIFGSELALRGARRD